MATAQEWHQHAAGLSFRNQAFIDGRSVNALSGATFDCISPVDGRLLTRIAACDEADVNVAVASARRAFEDGRWSDLAPARRKRVLLAVAERIEAAAEELALLETLDMGKPIGDSVAVDVPATVRCLRWYAEAIDKVYGEVAPTDPGALATITREPLGVVAAVVPWNFPLIMAMWKLAPALAVGNSVILKPAEQSTLTALRLAELFIEGGLPEGVLNVVPGLGHQAGRALARHMDVDAIAFTGSTEVGKEIMKEAALSNLKRVGLELGGKSPHIVLADCPDLDLAAATAASAIFFNQGEMCTAGSRLIVERSIADAVIEKVVGHAKARRVGDPLDPQTDLGALVDDRQMERVLGYVANGQEQGASLLTGGARLRQETGGYYVAPTVFAGVTPEMRIAREEIFGPVLACLVVDDAEHAVAVANDTVYGLAAAVWTASIDRALTVSRRLRAGMVYVNCYDADDITVPFGGYKQSGFGRDKSLHALEKYSELKTTWIQVRR